LTKACICFFGFLRTYEHTFQSYVEHITSKFDTDIFLYGQNIVDENDPTPVNIQTIKDIFGDRLIKYELFDYSIDFFKNVARNNNIPDTVSLNEESKRIFSDWTRETYKTFSMFYNIQGVLRLKEEYENTNNVKYDIVFLTRPDVKIISPINIGFDLNKVHYDECHIAPAHGSNPQGWLGDHLLMSNSKNISTLMNLYDKIPEYYKEGILVNNETLIYFHYKKYNIEITKSPFTKHSVIRSWHLV
jgi:hypothetical protein